MTVGCTCWSMSNLRLTVPVKEASACIFQISQTKLLPVMWLQAWLSNPLVQSAFTLDACGMKTRVLVLIGSQEVVLALQRSKMALLKSIRWRATARRSMLQVCSSLTHVQTDTTAPQRAPYCRPQLHLCTSLGFFTSYMNSGMGRICIMSKHVWYGRRKIWWGLKNLLIPL